MRQKQKGYFSLRIQVVGGNLTAENIKAVAEVAEKYGKGYVHMTSRQGVEIPFINFEDVETVRAELAKGGVNPGVCGPRVEVYMAARVNKDEFEGKVLKSDIPVLVDFYSDSCVPCKKMTPVIGDVEDDMEGKLAVYKVNINFDTELAESYDVQSVPTLLLFDKGSEKARQSGAVRKPQLVEWIEENLK